jgi:hypothetical protein
MGLGNSEVRIPNATDVLNARLVPRSCFHPKTLVLQGNARDGVTPVGAVIGSGNLTVSGLRTGYEAATVAVWTSPPNTGVAKAQLAAVRREIRVLEQFWASAETADDTLVDRYERLRRRRPVSALTLPRSPRPGAFGSKWTTSWRTAGAIAKATRLTFHAELASSLGFLRPQSRVTRRWAP